MNIRPIQVNRVNNVSFGVALGDRQTRRIITDLHTKIEENYHHNHKAPQNSITESINTLEAISDMTCLGENEPRLFLQKTDNDTIEGSLERDNNKSNDFRMTLFKDEPLENLKKLKHILEHYTDSKKSTEQTKSEKLISYIFNHSGQ